MSQAIVAHAHRPPLVRRVDDLERSEDDHCPQSATDASMEFPARMVDEGRRSPGGEHGKELPVFAGGE